MGFYTIQKMDLHNGLKKTVVPTNMELKILHPVHNEIVKRFQKARFPDKHKLRKIKTELITVFQQSSD